MTDKPLDTYIKSPPPVEPKSHYTYLEDQLSKLETVSKAHVVRIAEDSASAKALVQQESTARANGDTAQAQYTLTVAAETLDQAEALVTSETTARTTADTALASSITSLTATVGTLSSSITTESTTRATADTALGTRIDNLVLTNGSDAAVIIDEEASARISADAALGTRIDSLTATVGTNTGAISTEQTTRATRDDALATQLFTMSSGSSRIFIATSAPGSTGRQPGDVWLDSDDSYKPYVWGRAAPSATTGDYDWRDNSTGTYSNNVGNYAVYTQAISTLNTATSSQATSITNLQATVGNSTAGLVRDVSVLTDTVGNSTTGLVRDVSTLSSVTAQQRIYRQNSQPSTADRKVGDLWYDTSNGNAPYYWNGTSWIVNTDTTRSSQAALTNEQEARTSADTALASAIMTASAGTSRVYTTGTAPSSVGRQQGDVWFNTSNNFFPSVWYNNSWQANDTGAYTQYIGQLATVTTTATAAFDNAAIAQDTADDAATAAGQAGSTANTANNTANNLSYEWSVVGTLDGAPAGSIRLLGASRTNPATGVRSTTSNLIIDANTTINGSLLVADSVSTEKIAPNAVTATELASNAVTSAKIDTGAITEAKLAVGSVTAAKMPDGVIVGTKIANGAITTQKIAANAITANLINAGTITADKIVIGGITTTAIANNAVSNSAGGSSASNAASIQISLQAGDRVSIIASSAPGGSGGGSFSGNLQVFADYGAGAFLVSGIGITSFVESSALGFNGVAYFLLSSFKLPNATLLSFYTAPVTGFYSFTAFAAHSPNTSILVTGLRK